MKVKLNSLDLDATMRRAINAHVGKPGMATGADIRNVVTGLITAWLQDMRAEFCEACDRQNDPECDARYCPEHEQQGAGQ